MLEDEALPLFSLPLHTTIISRRLRSSLLRKWYVSLWLRVDGRGEGRRATRDDRAQNQVIRTRLLSAYPATRKLSLPAANLPKTTICDSLRRKLHTHRNSRISFSQLYKRAVEDTAVHAVEKGTASLLLLAPKRAGPIGSRGLELRRSCSVTAPCLHVGLLESCR